MTHREARAKLGSRRHRRSGTKTKVIPGAKGGSNARPPKYAKRRTAKGQMSNAAKVRAILKQGKAK